MGNMYIVQVVNHNLSKGALMLPAW